MVASRKQNPKDLPAPGDVVELRLGFDRVRGTVVESYHSGAHPQVVIELPPEGSGEDATTVTVPPDVIEPTESARSPWAEHQRYEQAVLAAIKRSISVSHAELRQNPDDVGPEIDLIVTSPQKTIVVEMKHSQQRESAAALQAALRQLYRIVHKYGYFGILVTDGQVPKRTSASQDIRVVRWRDARDDQALRNAFASM
jgi:Holliday junction resolvase-like predicted endonuclease